MKVILLKTGRIINASGGMEKVLFDMANNLSERGYETTVLGFENKIGKPFFHINKNVDFINAGIGYKERNWYINLKSLLSFNRELRSKKRFYIRTKRMAMKILPVIHNVKPDIIIVYDKLANFLIKDVMKLNIPVISMLHFDIESIFRKGYSYPNKSLEHCECIQVLCRSYVDILRRFITPKKIQHIPNVVRIPDKMALLENKRIINVARVNGEQKRQHILIQAFAQLPPPHSLMNGILNFGERMMRRKIIVKN